MPILSQQTIDAIRDHTTAAVPLTNLLGVLLDILGQETLIANDTPAPAYLLLFLSEPVPLVGQPSHQPEA